jgi:RHS repeat-associated protein
MAVYELVHTPADEGNEGTTSMKVTERHIYGSSRLGMDVQSVELIDQEGPLLDTSQFRILGLKQYEISNHLGNVLSVISDVKLAVTFTDQNNLVSIVGYKAVVISVTDYSPFGVGLYERSWSSPEYRYGFNGKEKDDEFSGEGNSYDFGARIYDGRLGRWLSVDPLMSKYPSLSPYNFVDNSTICSMDGDGRDIIVLCAPAGAHDPEGLHLVGHQALLVGNDDDGYYYYSFDGHDSEGNDGKTNGVHFDSLNEFANSEFNTFKDNYDDAKGIETSHRNEDGKIIQRYEQGYRITTSPSTDKEVKDAVNEFLGSAEYGTCGGYIPLGDVCTDVPKVALNTAGLQNGEESSETRYNSKTGLPYHEDNWLPATIQKAIEQKNVGTDVDSAIKRTTTNGDRAPAPADTNVIENKGDFIRELSRWPNW